MPDKSSPPETQPAKVVKSRTNILLVYAVIACGIFIGILLLSKYRPNVSFTWIFVSVAAVLLVWLILYYSRREKFRNIYEMANECAEEHFKNTGNLLDLTNIEAQELSPGKFWVYFKANGIAIERTTDKLGIYGVRYRQLSQVVEENERSSIIKTMSSENMAKKIQREELQRVGLLQEEEE